MLHARVWRIDHGLQFYEYARESGTPAPDGKHANHFDRLIEAANYRQGPRLGPEELAELRPRMPLLHAMCGLCHIEHIGKLVDGKREAELYFYSRTESVVLTPYAPMYFQAVF